MLRRLKSYPEREIVSARGRLIPILGSLKSNGGFLESEMLGDDLFRRWDWKNATSDCDVGAYAEELVEAACAARLLRFPVRAVRYEDIVEQRKGKDFRLSVAFDLEVKADVVGGIWGTGNLFVQTHEYKHQHADRNAHKEDAKWET